MDDLGEMLGLERQSAECLLAMTYGFGFVSALLFAFMVDIDVLSLCKVLKGFVGGHAFDLPIALTTVALGVMALWIAFAILLNPLAGRRVLPFPGPLFKPTPAPEAKDPT